MKRVFVSIPDGIWDIIEKDFKDKMGDSESEVIRNVVISYLSQRGYFINEKGQETASEISEKLLVLENMFFSMLETLEEKGTITYSEWESKMKKKISSGH